MQFNEIASELAALQNSAVVCPVGDMIRIVATGADRAKFLHNFCTNDIKAMKPGETCEAFFTDVKAKILAHGYLLAKSDSIEIQMLPGSEEAILKHLNRYIITEDVTITAKDIPGTTFAVMGPATLTVIHNAELPVPEPATGGCNEDSTATVMTAVWNNSPIAFVSVDATAGVETWNKLTAVRETRATNWTSNTERHQNIYRTH